MLFPSKGKTTWDGFAPPCKFKDGDIIYNQGIKATAIFYKQTNDNTISHCFLNVSKELKICHYHSKFLYDWRLATEEEKQKLFKAIKDNGYKWNPETKALEMLIVPNKFDITSLKTYDKVLVRDSNKDKWNIDFFAYYKDNGEYQCMTFTKFQCIPYEENKHLLGTTNDCDDFYKTWQK